MTRTARNRTRATARIWAVVPLITMLASLAAAPAPRCAAGEVVAVFNFAQRDDDPKYAWLSKGLADLLINQLADLPDITVVSRDRMQMLVSQYEKMADRQTRNAESKVLRPLATMLDAQRMVFGTYAVKDNQATLTIQVTGTETETVLWESQVSGAYEDVLTLERRLAQSAKAYFLGRPVERVPIGDVSQWTTKVGAAERLYAGVSLFDNGEYAEAWWRFRQAARADADYADAVYWQGRMLYYLLMYDNARPVLERFFARWPQHGRSGDAVIEILDSYRQTVDDPERLLRVYEELRQKVDPRTIIYNKTHAGRESRGLLKTYLGGFIVQAERVLGHHDRAVELAYRLHREARDSTPADIDYKEGFHVWQYQAYDQLWNQTANEQWTWRDRWSGPPEEDRLEKLLFVSPDMSSVVGRMTSQTDRARTRPWQHLQNGKYVMKARNYLFWARTLVAPDGYEFSDITFTMTCHSETGSTPYVATVSFQPNGIVMFKRYGMNTTDGTRTFVADPVHYCRRFRVSGGNYPLTTDPFDQPTKDYVEEIRIDFKLKPVAEQTGEIFVQLASLTDATILLDGRPAIMGEGLIRGVSPGRHTVTALPVRGTGRHPSDVYDSAETEVVVSGTERAVCSLSLPMMEKRRPAGWEIPRTVTDQYPMAKLSPGNPGVDDPPPTVLRVRRGSMAGALVVVWSFRDELWKSYSLDNGQNWTAAERLPLPVSTAHNELAPVLIQDEQERFVLAFLSDRNLQRAHYPYVTVSDDLQHWSAPRLVADLVADKLSFLQDQQGRYLLLIAPLWKPDHLVWGSYGNFETRVMELKPARVDAAILKKYARSRPVLLTSSDLETWSKLETNMGTDATRDADMVQVADGVYHLVFVTKDAEDSFRDSNWHLCHQTSSDAEHWSPADELRDSSWELVHPRITTDGQQVLGSVCIAEDHVSLFKIGIRDTVSWWGMAGRASRIYHDPPGAGARLHWVWCRDGQFRQGVAQYTSRESTSNDDWIINLLKKPPEKR